MSRRLAAAGLILLLTQLQGCPGGSVGVTESYDYWDGPAYGYDLDYFYGPPVYGPPVIYGGWGPDYFVGPPPRWEGRPPGWDRPPTVVPRPGGPPSFRPAPPTRPMPSIPSGPRGGGMRGAVRR
jgi:hypothetical protein